MFSLMQYDPILYGILQLLEKHFPVKTHSSTYIGLTQIHTGESSMSIQRICSFLTLIPNSHGLYFTCILSGLPLHSKYKLQELLERDSLCPTDDDNSPFGLKIHLRWENWDNVQSFRVWCQLQYCQQPAQKLESAYTRQAEKENFKCDEKLVCFSSLILDAFHSLFFFFFNPSKE